MTSTSIPGPRHSFLSHHDREPLGAVVRLAGFGYDRVAAADTWRRMLAFFSVHLSASTDLATA